MRDVIPKAVKLARFLQRASRAEESAPLLPGYAKNLICQQRQRREIIEPTSEDVG